MGLNLDVWERQAIYAEFGINRSDAEKSSVLIQDEGLHDRSWEHFNNVDMSPQPGPYKPEYDEVVN